MPCCIWKQYLRNAFKKIAQHWPVCLVCQVLSRLWTKPARSWKTEARLSPMPLSPRLCAARRGPPCWRASTSTTTTRIPTTRTAPPLPGRPSTSRAHLLCISTTPATGQVGEHRNISIQALWGIQQWTFKDLFYAPHRRSCVLRWGNHIYVAGYD